MATKKKQKENKAPQGAMATAILRHVRIAPRKMRLVAHMIKKMDVSHAQAQLFIHERRAAGVLLKLLKSALANAKNRNLDEKKLVVQDIRVDGGPMLKRWMPRAQGRATPIQKKTSHITLVLQETEKSVQSAFVVEKKKKEKKEKKEDAKKPKTSTEKEKDQETPKIEQKVNPQAGQKGFIKRVFRRKSI